MRGIVFLIFASSTIVFGQRINYEEKALHYFFERVYPLEYPQEPAFRFKGKTQVQYTRFGIRDNCFDKQDYAFYAKIDSVATNLERLPKIASQLTVDDCKRIKKSSKNEMKVYKATAVSIKYYVEITLNFKSDHSDSFFIELDERGQALRMCKTSLIY
jgi:hypothetical protein